MVDIKPGLNESLRASTLLPNPFAQRIQLELPETAIYQRLAAERA